MIFISACSDSPLNSQKQQKKQEISKIDGKPIIKINAADLTHSKRLHTWLNKVGAKDGPAIVRALREKSASLKKYQTASVALKDLKNYVPNKFSGSKAGNSSSGGDIGKLADAGSELHIKDADGSTEAFIMRLHPYVQHPNKESSLQVVQRMAANMSNSNSGGDTYLALDPDRFYLTEKDGKEQWPVTFPAISLTDSSKKIMVTFNKAGFVSATTSSGQSLTTTSSANTTSSRQPNLVFAEGTPIMQPDNMQIAPGGGGGGGSGGGGGDDGGNDNDPDRFKLSVIQNAPFLALKTLRLNVTGDGDGAAELQMYVDPHSTNKKYNREWNFTFDHKRGMTNRPLWFNDFSFFGILNETYKIFTDIQGQLKESAESVFHGRNTRTFGADSRIYKTPDVNYANIDYHFTNMRNWKYFTFPNFFQGYAEGPAINYFPLVMLTNHPYRLMLMDDDKKYPYASARRRHVIENKVWTYNMVNGSYKYIDTSVDAHRHKWGTSDDLFYQAGVSNITESTVDDRMGANLELTIVSPGGLKYVFKKIYRRAEFRPLN